jgi:PAS domain S-box-containing protein
VVLADDNADLRGYIARLLSERGHDVRPVGDGLAALEALRAERPDILVTDVMMPGLDGFGLLRAVRDDPALRDLPVLMLSARAGEEAKVEGLDAGADDYLTKPFSARELLARVAANVAMARVRREAAEAIRASETRAARVLAGMTEGYVLFDRDLRVVEVNDAAVRIDGRPRERLLGRLHGEVWPGSELAPLFAKVMERQEPGTVEEHYVWPDGHAAWLEVNIYPVADGLAVFFRDVSDRRRAQERLRELNATLEARVDERTRELLAAEEALRQAQKMEAVGQLTGGIAHDFNNLLTIVTGNVDMARRALGNAELGRAARALENALKGAERAASLTQRLLAFSRRQPLAPKPISVDRLVSGMAELLHRALGETVSLETVTTPGLWRVEADPNQLESALLNLAVNARDAMPRGGKLLLETANVHLDQQYAAVHAEVAPGNYVVIAMTDTGCGMSRETLARVFDPFFTTKEVGKGTGLGLSMVYGFVKQSGGHIKIYSEPGEGTTVKIYLPRLMSGEVVEEERSAPPVDRAKRGLTILVVEDDDDLRGYTVEILRELGYRVLEAHDGPAALRLLERPELVVDLLFTDVVMPAMSGRELADKTREMRPGLKVLYTSGYTRNAIVHGGRLDLGVEMIAKPFSYNGLAEKISDMLDGGQSGRVLVVEADPAVRMFAVEALREAGFTADEAADAAEALGRIRAAQGGYDAVVIDAGLPGKPGDALAADIRAERADLKLLICGGGDLSRLRGERGVAVIGKPYEAEALYAALASLGVQRRVAIPPG